MEEDKIIQIIPAPGWVVDYEGGLETGRLAAWGLTQSGDLVPMHIDPQGTSFDSRKADDFVRVRFVG